MEKKSPPRPKILLYFNSYYSKFTKEKKHHKALLLNSMRSDVGAHKHKWNRGQKTKKERIKIR